MKKSNKLLLLSAASIGLIGSLLLAVLNPGKAMAQSDCYLINENGQYIDLSKICDAPKPSLPSRSRQITENRSLTNANLIDNLPIQIINNNAPRRYVTVTRKNYTIIRERGIVRNDFLNSVSDRYNNTGNRILTISDPYFSGSQPIIYRYQK